MKQYQKTKSLDNFDSLIKLPPVLLGDEEVVESPAEIYIDGRLEIVLLNIDRDISDLSWATRKIPMHSGNRVGGLSRNSRMFGYRPRMRLRLTSSCSVCSLAVDCPKENSILEKYAHYLDAMARVALPERYKTQRDFLESNVLDSWRWRDTAFTSGIVNRNYPFRYHYDRGNIQGGMSAMIVLKEKTEGGDLHLPQIKTLLKFKHGDVLFFDGQSFLHSVTPIKNTNASGHRHSVVYYALKQMCKCLPIEEELKDVQKLHSGIARRRAKLDEQTDDANSQPVPKK